VIVKGKKDSHAERIPPMVKELPERFNELGAFIREQRGSARLSLRRLSELAGISNPYLSQIERGLRRPSAEILQQIAKALRISAETLYVQAGILEKPDGNTDLGRHIYGDNNLNEEQKQAMMRIYLSFRHENEDNAEVASAAGGAAGAARAGGAGGAGAQKGAGGDGEAVEGVADAAGYPGAEDAVAGVKGSEPQAPGTGGAAQSGSAAN
jgi:transcriptional regulator with XRE-family HTH domain